ncbi:MAG: hypothetical protein ABS99_04200 [Acetobacteraceae bacterium SCN 69-10]|nr:MAG: hypothetical protein ABS99_04200 [Acetobacteraceae bacterium SCN 69-10]
MPGAGASAVGLSMEVEGDGAGVVVGDDALVSGGVWIRNHDMHAIHDLATGARLDRPPVTTVLERHVWLGQDAMLLNTERVGMGAIVGARALVKGVVPPRVVAAGTPARVGPQRPGHDRGGACRHRAGAAVRRMRGGHAVHESITRTASGKCKNDITVTLVVGGGCFVY